jgi:hypothetical protein
MFSKTYNPSRDSGIGNLLLLLCTRLNKPSNTKLNQGVLH